MDLVYFIVLVGVLIFVHESGHFLWAKLFGVRVLRFSLGFGPKIAGFTRGDTEYVIAAVPLGGYVRMLGENPHDEVRGDEASASFMGQPLWKRVVIVCAGPLMNLSFPVLLYFVVFLGQHSVAPAIVGDVFSGEPADGKLQPDDRVLAVDGEPVETFRELTRSVAPHAGRTLSFTIERDGETLERTITPNMAEVQRPLELSDRVGRIGIASNQKLATIGVSDPSGPAALAQLKTFDWIISANGKPTERWVELERALDKNRGWLMPLTVLRPERVPSSLGSVLGVSVFAPHVVTLMPEPGTGDGPARAGLEQTALYISQLTQRSPEAAAGLRAGDRIVALDGKPVRLFSEFLAQLEASKDREHEVVIKRAGAQLTVRYRLERRSGTDEFGQPYQHYASAIRTWAPTIPQTPIDNPSPISFALSESLRLTGEVVELTAFSIVRLFQGRLSMKSIGGPLQMYDAAGDAARGGAFNFLLFMGFISVNLGLINLMPIPVLDGGHLLFFLLELVWRKPLSVRFREYASIAGLSVLILLMVFAFKNDVERQWPQLVGESARE